MKWREIFGGWTRSVDALKKKWANYSDRLVISLAEEEMEIRREQILKQIKAQNQQDLGGMSS
jgi:hypothetical protein